MAEHSGTKSFLGNLASNAVWEWIKAIGGGLLSSFITAFTQYIRHRPIDWWGLLALAIVTTVVIGLILNRERSTNTTIEAPLPLPIDDSPPWAAYGSEQAWHSAIAEQNRLVNLGHSVDGMFNESQREALMLRRDLQRFLASETERAKSRLTGSDFDKKQMWKLVWHNRDAELTARYKLEMKAWTEMVYNQLILSGAHSERFEWLAENACTHEQIYEMTNLLWEMVGEVGKYRDDKD